MSEFKAGDKIRLLTNFNEVGLHKGQITEVIEDTTMSLMFDNMVLIKWKVPEHYNWAALGGLAVRIDEIELVEESKQTTKSPSHYTKGSIQPIDYIEAIGLDKNFNLANAVKYISRCEHKGQKKSDLEKAIWYLQRELGKLD